MDSRGLLGDWHRVAIVVNRTEAESLADRLFVGIDLKNCHLDDTVTEHVDACGFEVEENQWLCQLQFHNLDN